MEFIKINKDRYLVKNSNAHYVNEAEKNRLLKAEKATVIVEKKKNKKESAENGNTELETIKFDVKSETTTVTK